jgi:hypothetical protein
MSYILLLGAFFGYNGQNNGPFSLAFKGSIFFCCLSLQLADFASVDYFVGSLDINNWPEVIFCS